MDDMFQVAKKTKYDDEEVQKHIQELLEALGPGMNSLNSTKHLSAFSY